MTNVGFVRGDGQMPFLPRSIADNDPALDGVPLVQDSGSEGSARSGTLHRIPTMTSGIAQQGAGLTHLFNYGESITIGQPLYLTTTAEQVKRANATAIATMPVVGIALETASSGLHEVLVFGTWRDDSLTLSTIGGLVYVATTVGTWTQTAPIATDSVIQPVAIAINTHVMFFHGGFAYTTHT